MGGGLMQLVAYGAQDIYLTGNPQITFFKVVYRRHTNFSMEAIQQTWNGDEISADGRCTATISRNGDLVHKMYLEVGGTGTNSTAANNPGSAFIKNVSVEIGGQTIDTHTGVWMETWSELTQPNRAGHVAKITANVVASGDGTAFQNSTGMGGVAKTGGATPELTYRVPLYFWFCRNPGLALPLIALQYHEVKIILEHTINTIFHSTSKHNTLWCDYIYLDTDERRRFAQVSHEYLIEQVQSQSIASAVSSQDINFNHPVKELIWTAADDAAGTDTSTTLTSPSLAKNNKILLKLNGHDRFAAREATYFSRTQVLEHHTGGGGLLSVQPVTAGSGNFNDSICVYSFALKPEEHQPSGTCNFSRIDNAQLVWITGTSATTGLPTLFAVNYNVLRIMSGMGGLAYSN